MGQVIESCNLKCCENENNSLDKKKTYLSQNSEDSDDDYENQYKQIEYSRYYCVTETPKTSIDFPVKIKNLFFQHFSNPWSVYTELKDIGEGAYGVVKKVCLKSNPEVVRAMKIIPKENIIENENGNSFLDEIEILKNLEHPNIMKIYESFNDKKNVYIVSEYCDEGDLLGKMEKLGSLNQIVVKFLMDQIFNAIAYLHSNHIFHGDIKLENVMLYKTSLRESRRFSRINRDLNKNKSLQNEIEKSFNKKKFVSKKSVNYIEDMNNYEVKLIDFGCCKYLVKKKDNNLSGIVGTSIYCSPEVINNLYDEKSDEWACGVLMYILLCGEPPFTGETEEEIFKNIKRGKFSFSQPQFNNVSDNCIDLIKKLLTSNKKYRIKASDALKHPFFTENYNPNIAMANNMDKNLLKRLLEVKKLPSKFHELIEAYLCFNFISKDEEKELRKIFRYLDRKGKNRLLKSDFAKCFEENGINATDEQIQNIFNALDSDGNNSIEYQEFLRAMCNKETLYSDKNLKAVYNSMDTDKKGYVDMDDVKKFIFQNKQVEEEKFINYLNKIGMDLKSKFEFNQFVDIIRNQKIFNHIKNSILKNTPKEEDEKNKEDININ
jgi:calcium-dependent protein kinase